MPQLQNCEHQGEGWCLKCVKGSWEEMDYLAWFRVHCDFGPAHGDVISSIEKEYEKSTGSKVPNKWRSDYEG